LADLGLEAGFAAAFLAAGAAALLEGFLARTGFDEVDLAGELGVEADTMASV